MKKIFDHLKSKTAVHFILRFSSYLTENTADVIKLMRNTVALNRTVDVEITRL